jgi:uncharacterized protein
MLPTQGENTRADLRHARPSQGTVWRRLGPSLCVAFTLAVPSPRLSAASPKADDLATWTVRPFLPAELRLLDGPFKTAFDENTGFLLRIEPDRLLHRFLAYSGLPPKGEVYGGWEAEGLSGHSLGHYLSACSLAYAGSGDERLRERVSHIVEELARAQAARGDGYVGAIPNQDALFKDIGEARFFNIRQNYINDFWAPWYTIHKVLAGLLDAHRHCANETALRVAEQLGRWAIRVTSMLDHEAWQKMLGAEFGGMNEALAELFARTGDRAFLDLSRRFNHEAVMDPLAAGQDKLMGLHANTQIPKVIGAARDYELSGDERRRRIATFFWETVTRNHTYANGGNSEGEYFGPPGILSTRLTDNTSESCNTYNMLKLTQHLFGWEPKAAYADYAERALFNHILASTEPRTGMKCYSMPLAGMPKDYSTPFDSFWCCVGTGWENPPRYTDSIYFRDAGSLYVNLFVASRVDWKEKGVTLTQETRFPEEDVTRLKIGGKGGRFALKIRSPFWAASPVAIRLNGAPHRASTRPGEFVTIERAWRDGDVVEVRLPMGIRTEATPDDPSKVSMFYGPILLAADLGPEDGPSAPMPVLVAGNQRLEQAIRPAFSEGPLRFRTAGLGRPADVLLGPYYLAHHRYCPVYFDKLSETEWAAREAARRDLEARTLDRLLAGEKAAATAHFLDTSGARVGLTLGRWGWQFQNDSYCYVSFDLDPKGAANSLELRLSVFGEKDGAFDVVVNGVRVGETEIKKQRPLRVEDLRYPIPEGLVRSSGKLKVWIVPKPRKPGPVVFDASLVRKP